jgi:hypothetical protein
MSDIFGKLKSGAGKVAKETDRIAHVKRIEMEIGSIKKQIDDQYHKLGEIIYKNSLNKEAENPEANNIIAKITGLNEQIREKEEEIKKINTDEQAPRPPMNNTQQPIATPGKKFCTNCGKENDSSVKFCAECGTKLS